VVRLLALGQIHATWSPLLPVAARLKAVTTTQAEFYRGVEVAARASALATHADAAVVASAVHSAMSRLFEATAEDQPRACASGCSHCCHYPVGVSYGEALLLARAVAEDRDLRDRVMSAWTSTRDVPSYALVGNACPLLAGGICAVYEVRPVPCRALASADAMACAAALRAPVAVPRDEKSYWQGLGASDVLGAGDPQGLRELRSAVAALLESPDPTAFTQARPIS